MLSFESPIRTRWHSVPVGVKLALLCVSSLILFQLESPGHQALALVLCVACYLICGYSFFIAGVQRLRFLWPFLLVIALWAWYSNTPQQGLAIALRLLSIVGFSNLVTMTSSLSGMLETINKLLSPIRTMGINTRPVELAIALLVRFTPVLIGKGELLKASWRARAIRRPGWRLVFPICLVAVDDAERVAEALRARGGTQRQDTYTAD